MPYMSFANRLRFLLPAGWRARDGANLSGCNPRRGFDYEAAYEDLAKRLPREQAIGGGGNGSWYELGGRIELGVLEMEGLQPTHTLVDFGCGNGRLAVKVIPRLSGGTYIGIDISETMLREAARLVRKAVPQPPCSVRWSKQSTPAFALASGSVDLMCAFSVFTHLEHEDTFRYLADARRVIKPQGRFVFSCLPIRLAEAQVIFRHQASLDLKTRWRGVRNVVTTVEMMDAIARMAGWRPLKWYPADRACIRVPESGECTALGQEICVLEPSGG
jgi:SAM-dependent methyltransferase